MPWVWSCPSGTGWAREREDRMIRGGGRRALVALLAVAAVAVSGCDSKGGATGDPAKDTGAGAVAGLPVTHFESGLKPDAPTPTIDVKNADGGEDDKLATAAIDDVQTYWNERLPADFGEQFEPVKSLLSYDSQTDTEKTGCGSVKKLVNAFFCLVDDSVAWDRGVLLPMLRQRFGPMSVVGGRARGGGRAGQYRRGGGAGGTGGAPAGGEGQ